MLLTLLAAVPSWGKEPKPDDDDAVFAKEDYPRDSVKKILSREPCKPRVKEPVVKDVLFSAEMRWQGGARAAPPERRKLLKLWAEKAGDPEAAGRYGQERSFIEDGVVYWAAVPDAMLSYLKMDFQPGDQILVYFSFAGCVEGKPALALEEYEESGAYDATGEEDVVV